MVITYYDTIITLHQLLTGNISFSLGCQFKGLNGLNGQRSLALFNILQTYL